MANLSSMIDLLHGTSFSSLWNAPTGSAGSVTATSTGMSLNYDTGASDNAEITGAVLYTFDSLSFQVVSYTSFEGAAYVQAVDQTSGDYLGWSLDNGSLLAIYDHAGTETTLATGSFSLSTQSYLRVRTDGTNFYWETSANSTTWATYAQVSVTTSALILSPNNVAAVAGVTTDAANSAAGATVIDNLNVYPVTSSEITWSGYAWTPKTGGPTSPDDNYWDDSGTTARVDAQGNLILNVWYNGTDWQSSYLSGPAALGYGTYTWVVNTDMSQWLDVSTVFNLFTYDPSATGTAADYYSENDIQFAYLGQAVGSNFLTVGNQPEGSGQVADFTIQDLTAPYTCTMVWAANSVTFEVTGANGQSVSFESTTGVEPPNGALPTLGFWVGGNSASPSAPSTGIPQQVSLASFSYTAPPAPAGWPDYYTYNFNTNPSAESGLAGYGPVYGSETVSTTNTGWAGSFSVQVQTPGNAAGEGLETPEVTVPASATGSASFYVYGESGALVATAVDSSGTTLGSASFVLSGSWQQVVLNDLTLTGEDTLQLLIQTTTAQALNFLVDAVQYEPESPAHAYIDGNSPNCAWTGLQNLSASYQQYEFPISMSGTITIDGDISLVARGEDFSIGNADPSAGPVVLIEGQLDVSGYAHDMVAVSGTRTVIPPATDPGVPGVPWEIAGGGTWSSIETVSPANGVSDFAFFATTQVDPAISMVGENNAGTTSGQTSYNRVFGTFTPPVQNLNSAGTANWQSAAYMAVGFEVTSAVVGDAINFVDVQVEKVPLGQTAPSAYQLPRSLNTIITPSNMNFVTNPSFEVSDANWTAVNSATLSIDTTQSVNGSQSLQVVAAASGEGVSTTLTDLVAGATYTASAYVLADTDTLENITLSVGGTETSATSFGSPLFGGDTTNPGYGDGEYGGVSATATAMPTGVWYRAYVTFVAPDSTTTLELTSVNLSGSATFNVDAVMVAPGAVLTDYADGNSDQWQWELGGTAGLSRSYYYERQQVAARAVESVLEQHIPLGISYYAPLYRTPPTQ